jgi:S1-C subfamily serine protease
MKQLLLVILLLVAGIFVSNQYSLVRQVQRIEDKQTKELSVKTILSVVRIENETYIFGSGVCINAHQLLTAAHVVQNSKIVKVTLFNADSSSRNVLGRVIRVDPQADLALVEVTERLKYSVIIGLSDCKRLNIGSVVYACGCACGLYPTINPGYFTGRNTNEEHLGYWQTSANVYGGCSGGGVFNDKGYLLGIISARMGENVGFFVSVLEVELFLKN